MLLARRGVVGPAALFAVVVGGCGSRSRTTTRPRAVTPARLAKAQDSNAERQANGLASVVEACAVSTSDFRQCQAFDDLKVFVSSCLQDNQGDTAHCGGPAADGMIDYGTAGGQAEVTHASARTYRVTAFSVSGNSFTLQRRADGSKRRTCRVSSPTPGECIQGAWGSPVSPG
jgi:hypothetical protein